MIELCCWGAKLYSMIRFIPNIFTLGRLVLTFVFVGMVFYSPKVAAENRWWFLDIAFVIFVVAGLTDIFDGVVARRLNVTSKFGRMIDPLVDKVLVCGTFICFALIGRPRLFELSHAALAVIHWSVAALLIAREFYVTVLRHLAEARGVNFAATMSGKVKMVLQSFAIGTVIIKAAHVEGARWGDWFTTITFAIMMIVTVISGIRATQRKSWKQAAA